MALLHIFFMLGLANVLRGGRISVLVEGIGLDLPRNWEQDFLYMQKTASVIEIVPAGYSVPPANSFENLSKLAGLKYRKVFSSALDKDGFTTVSPTKVLSAISDVAF